MKEYEMIENQDIDILEFIMDFFEQWRGWFTAGLLCMLLLCGYKYVTDMNEYNSIVRENGEDRVMISPKQMVALSNPGVAINYFVIWQQQKEAYDESLIMRLDSTNVRRLNIEYFIKCENGGSDCVASIYSNLISDEHFLNDLSRALGVEGAKNGSVSELISINAGGSGENPCGSFLVTIILVEGADETKVEETVTDYLISFSKNISPTVGTHTISLIASGVITIADEHIVQIQGEAVSNINTWKNSFFKMYKDFSDEDKKEVDNVIERIYKGELNYQDVRELYPAQKTIEIEEEKTSESEGNLITMGSDLNATTFSRKYAILGFVIGVFLYSGILLLVFLFDKRSRNGEEISRVLSLRSYGSLYNYPYHGIVAFFHDRRIYTWRHKKASKIDDIVQAISAKAKFDAVSKLTCLVIGVANKEELSKIQEIAKRVSDSGVGIDIKNAPLGLASLSEEEIGGLSPVLFTVLSRKSKPVQVAEMMVRMREYNVPVFGMNFVEN